MKPSSLETHEGPPRYFVPVCVLTPLGFIGGPSDYQEVGEDDKDRGPIVETLQGGLS